MKDPLALREEFTKIILSHDYSKAPLLILAGPGTGKTYSLIETIIFQVANGSDLRDFFVTTLTNAAAGEFEEEVKARLSADFENVSTLHFRAKGIVHRYADLIGLNPSFTVLNDLEIDSLLKEIQYTISTQKKIKAKEVNALFAQYEAEVANNKTITMNSFVLAYQQLKKFYNVVDWYDVLYFACKILTENEDALQKEASRQSFILVDEYQDLNKADQDLIKLISNDSQLLVVGDDDQSIYSGRYADPTGIVNFHSLYPGTEIITSPVCSRCPTAIIEASYSLINKNDSEKRKVKPKLIALPDTDKNADGGFIASVGLKSAKEESKFLGAAIKVILQDGLDRARDIMVLCSSRALGIELINGITKIYPDIPIHDNLTKENKEELYIVVNYLKRFLDDYEDNLALRMFLELFFEFSPISFSIILDIVKDANSLWEAIQQATGMKELKKEKEILEKFIGTVSAVNGSSSEEKLKVFSQEYPTLRTAIEQLMSNLKACGEIKEEDEQRSVKSASVAGVQFMTMHRSKGLDAKYVFIPFMEEEIKLPAIDVEEQRRLLYVALARARVAVLITWAFSRQSATRHKAGGGGFMSRHRSSFINDCSINKDTPPQHALNRLSQLAKISQ